METNCTLPCDILEEIMCLLPVSALLRIRCVCKLWCEIVDNPIFINKHHKQRYAILKEQGDIPMLFSGGEQCMNNAPPIQLFSKKYTDVLLDLTHDLRRDSATKSKLSEGLYVVGCANGIVLLLYLLNQILALWNPATREFKIVPQCCPLLGSKYSMNVCELGFVPKSNDFKIIVTVSHCYEQKHYRCEMYSVNADSWKTIEDPYDLSSNPIGGHCVCINNKHYWSDMGEHGNLIISFDWYNEVFQVFDQPGIEGYHISTIENYKGSLAFISIMYQDEERLEGVIGFEIWVMANVDDLGIPVSLEHLFTIGPFPEIWINSYSFSMDGDMLMTFIDGFIEDITWLYDPTTKKIIKTFEFEIRQSFEYVESLSQLSNKKFNI